MSLSSAMIAGVAGLQSNSTAWEYDGNDWKQVLPAHSPSVRYGLSLAYDSGRAAFRATPSTSRRL